MPFNLDYFNKIVQITSPDVNIQVQELHDYIEDQMASPVGLSYPEDDFKLFDGIINPQGKIDTNPVTPNTNFSQIILVLHPDWQIQFWSGSGVSRLQGGTIVGGIGNNPVKASGNGSDITYFQSPLDGTLVQAASNLTDIQNAVWGASVSSYTDKTTFGGWVGKKLLTFAKFVGLK